MKFLFYPVRTIVSRTNCISGIISYQSYLIEAEHSNISQRQQWFRGGFPLALTAHDENTFLRWAENFIRSYVERDLSLLFGV